MGVLSNLEPGRVFYYFEEIAGIPHGSGNVGRISDYLADFARKKGLFVVQDALKNIIIVKEATPGYEEEPALILQGHMDMVAVKKPDCDMDLEREGLRLAVEGDKVYARGTSLGGDDGIAVAYMLALLEDDSLKHPRLEAVITVDEEVGMDGARGIDLSRLTAKRMLNLDSEEEGIFLTSCAGGARVHCSLPVHRREEEGFLCEITVSGLQGGHSGSEIHKERGNSNCLMARALWNLSGRIPIRLVGIQGGLADNAIPRQTRAVVLIPRGCDVFAAMEKDPDAPALLDAVLEETAKAVGEELATRDPGFSLKWKTDKTGVQRRQTFSGEDTRRAAALLSVLPCGVQAMSADIPGMVETSLNLGMLEDGAEGISATFLLRSSVESAKYALIERMKAAVELAGGEMSVSGDYPGWKYRVDSPLRDKMVKLYTRMYGEAPRVEAIHAGLECGILGSKIEGLDCVSIGPDMQDIHTTEETLSISSTARVWEFLVKLLEEKD